MARATDQEITHSMAHYLLAIHDLKESKGYARVTDIAKKLDLTKGSVSTAINNLKSKDLVFEEDESKFLNLTNTGHDIVHEFLTNKTLIYYFFKDFLNVSDEVAHRDSCLIEHLISKETQRSLFSFIKKLSCHCDEKGKPLYETEIDLCKYEDPLQFKEDQKGSSHL